MLATSSGVLEQNAGKVYASVSVKWLLTPSIDGRGNLSYPRVENENLQC